MTLKGRRRTFFAEISWVGGLVLGLVLGVGWSTDVSAHVSGGGSFLRISKC